MRIHEPTRAATSREGRALPCSGPHPDRLARQAVSPIRTVASPEATLGSELGWFSADFTMGNPVLPQPWGVSQQTARQLKHRFHNHQSLPRTAQPPPHHTQIYHRYLECVPTSRLCGTQSLSLFYISLPDNYHVRRL